MTNIGERCSVCCVEKETVHFTSVDHGTTVTRELCPACFEKSADGFSLASRICEYCGGEAHMVVRAPIESAFGLWPGESTRREMLCNACYLKILQVVTKKMESIIASGTHPDFVTVTPAMIQEVRLLTNVTLEPVKMRTGLS